MDWMNMVITSVLVLIAIFCTLVFCKSILNFQRFKKRLLVVKVGNYLTGYGDDVIKCGEFFSIENSGRNPCEPLGFIDYIDYIQDIPLITEMKKNDTD